MRISTIKKLLLTVLAAVLFSLFADGALAAIQLDDNMRPESLPTFETQEGVEGKPETVATQTLIYYVGSLVAQVLLFTGAITILFLIWSGFNYITAFGKDEKIEKGKLGVFWSLVGLLIILLSYAIVQGVLQIVLQVDESAI